MSFPLITATAAFIEQKFADEGSGHDWAHIRRVWLMARRLAVAAPEADQEVTELAALLHDIADWKFHGGDYEAGPRAAREWLRSQEAPEALIARVETIIREVSFKGLGVETPVSSVEAALVQDADRLDAIGAIGIARAFAYGGHKGRPLHDPAIAPVAHDSFASYQLKNPVTDADLKAEYDKFAASNSGKEYKARHILVEKESEATAIIASLKKGGKFDEIAKKQSKDAASGAKGGDLDWANPSSYVPEFSEAMLKLSKGQTTETPVKSQFGYHVIRVDDIRSAQLPSFDEVKPQIAQQMQQQKLAAFQEDLRKKAKVE